MNRSLYWWIIQRFVSWRFCFVL
uniref:Uncharacterized protein n=1 Tax=Arundo donax TaxID=35708 RepID=A0A0A9FD83_ARUDO